MRKEGEEEQGKYENYRRKMSRRTEAMKYGKKRLRRKYH